MNNHTAPPETGRQQGDTVMKTELTLNALQSMNAQEYEDIRAAGSDMRRNLTHEVMREVDAPANWMMNGEYGSEFGAFSPSRFVSRQPTNVSTWHYVRRETSLSSGCWFW